MYGTVAMCSVLPENAERLMALAAAEDGLGIEGYLGTEVMVAENHPNTMLMVVRFSDRESYVANADSPGQDARYQRVPRADGGRPRVVRRGVGHLPLTSVRAGSVLASPQWPAGGCASGYARPLGLQR